MFTTRPRSLRRRPAPRDFRRLLESLPDAVLIVWADAPRYTIAAALAAMSARIFSAFAASATPSAILWIFFTDCSIFLLTLPSSLLAALTSSI